MNKKFLSVAITALFLLLLLFAIFLRFYQLADKTFHYDESQYAYFAYNYSIGLSYKYDPMLHGPFLFHFLAGIYNTFSDSDFTARLPAAIFGLLLLIIPWLFAPAFDNKRSKLVFFIAVAFSPLILYYSRFLRHDPPTLFFNFSFLLGIICFYQTKLFRWLFLSIAFLALMFCSKENTLPHLVIFGSFLIWQKIAGKKIIAEQAWPSLKIWQIATLLLTFSLIFVTLYSSLFSNWPGVIDGLYRKSILYWFELHSIRRIKGPFHFYLLLMLIYELPLLFYFCRAIKINIFREEGAKKQLLVSLLLMISLSAILQTVDHGSNRLTLPSLHLDLPWHIPLCGWLIFLALFCSWKHLKREEIKAAFFCYLSFAMLGLYSYLGEKVPWLSLYIIFPMIFYLAFNEEKPALSQFSFKNKGRRKQLLLLLLLLVMNLTVALRASFFLENNPRERIIDIAYVPELSAIMQKIDYHYSLVNNPMLAIVSEPTFPFSWYLRNYQTKDFSQHPHYRIYDILLTSPKAYAKMPRLLQSSYSCQQFVLRDWWVPNNRQANLKKLADYFLWRKIFSERGQVKSLLCFSKE